MLLSLSLARPFEEFQDTGPDSWLTQSPAPSIYDLAVRGTCVPACILEAIAKVESNEIDSAIGDDGRSLGRMQINEDFRELRVAVYGKYDPHNPYDATRIAALILQDHFRTFRSWPYAVSAYNQGAGATRKKGLRLDYLSKVERKLGWKL